MTKAEAAVVVAEAAAMITHVIPEHCRPVRKGGWHRAPPALGGCLVGVTGRLARASGRRVVSTPGAATCAKGSRSESAGCCHAHPLPARGAFDLFEAMRMRARGRGK